MELKRLRLFYLRVKLVQLLELFSPDAYRTSMVGRGLFKYLLRYTLCFILFLSLQMSWLDMARDSKSTVEYYPNTHLCKVSVSNDFSIPSKSIVFALSEMCSCFIWTTYSAYGVEVIGPSKRKFFGSLVGIMHSFGFILVSVLAMYFPDRQLLTIACASVFALNLFYLPFIPESPVWLLSKVWYQLESLPVWFLYQDACRQVNL